MVFEKFYNKEPDSVSKRSEGGSATLLVDFDNTKRMFEGEVIENMTILDVLNASVAAGKLKLIYVVDGRNNTTVTEINDHTVNEGQSFSFYRNDKKVSTGDINKTYVYPGDKITIKIE